MSANNILKSEEEMAKHHGRGYQCLCCLSKGVQYVAEKIWVKDHIMKMHLSLDEVTFYCSLCMFKCKTSTTLDNHLVRYRRHALIAVEKKVDAADRSCLRANPNSYQIQDMDYLKLDRDDSRVHFLLRKQGDQPALLPEDLLDAPVRESQISEVESGPASAVNASNKEQLWDLFQDFIRKQAPVPLPAPMPLPAPVPLPAQAPLMISTGPPPSTLGSLEVAQKLVEAAITCSSEFTSPSESSVAASVSLEP